MTESDNNLIDFTDKLLDSNDNLNIQPEDLTDEERMVWHLKHLIRPDESLSATASQNLTRDLLLEFEKTDFSSPAKKSRRNNIIPFQINSIYVMAAASFIALIAVVAVLASANGTDSGNTGTASGDGDFLDVMLILGGVGVVIAIGWFALSRRR